MSDTHPNWDAIGIGTGFGGAVVACRLAQAGLRVLVLERGRRYESAEPTDEEEPWSDYPRLPASDRALPDLARWVWSQDQGLWDVRNLSDVMVAQAAGYGGGSLIYANVHLRPPDSVFDAWPGSYDRATLDPYYELVAAMLDIQPITQAPFHRLIKTDQMLQVAKKLGRKEAFFHPPLAVTYEATSNNGFGKAQGACRACGECITGCRYRAKNTLDMNYLARVDSLANAEVRTQAEVLLISRAPDGYEVKYCDHLRGRATLRARAKRVFVCAGSINTTELLLESKRWGKEQVAGRATDGATADRGLPDLDAHDTLGSRYFANADALGMVYDGKLPGGDADTLEERPRRPLAPTVGPTITTSLAHQADGEEGHWFLLQEGGFPKALARHVGFMRAPIWLRRNRYERPTSDGNLADASPPPDASRLPRVPEPSPLGGAGGIADGPLFSLVDGAYRVASRGEIAGIMPKKLGEKIDVLKGELDAVRQREVRATIVGVKRRLVRGDAERAVQTIYRASEDPEHDHPVFYRAMVLLFSFLYALVKDDRIVEATNQTFDERYHLGDPLTLAAEIGKKLLRFDDEDSAHSSHSLVLLGMGPDANRGRVTLDQGGDLEVELPVRYDAPVYSAQERVMRDVAATLGGKLRVNPLWSYMMQPITVHSQGGCPMSVDPQDGVANEWGEVHGHPGLFVVDGALFPSPVGVNPSSTIAAVAERIVEKHIGDILGKSWRTPDWQRTAAWEEKQGHWSKAIDDAFAIEPPFVGHVPTKAKPIRIEFEEKMSGFHSARTPTPVGDVQYEEAEAGGRPAQPVSFKLTGAVEDVSAFLRDERRRIAMKGTMRITWPAAGVNGQEDLPASGSLELLTGQGAQRRMVYRIVAEVSEAESIEIDAYKRIRDDPGPDAWRDTTTLYFTMRRPDRNIESHGTLHMAMDDFLFSQLPSFVVRGTTDPARVAWAIGSFGTYFFGRLQRVYAPQLGRVVDLVEKLDMR